MFPAGVAHQNISMMGHSSSTQVTGAQPCSRFNGPCTLRDKNPCTWTRPCMRCATPLVSACLVMCMHDPATSSPTAVHMGAPLKYIVGQSLEPMPQNPWRWVQRTVLRPPPRTTASHCHPQNSGIQQSAAQIPCTPHPCWHPACQLPSPQAAAETA